MTLVSSGVLSITIVFKKTNLKELLGAGETGGT